MAPCLARENRPAGRVDNGGVGFCPPVQEAQGRRLLIFVLPPSHTPALRISFALFIELLRLILPSDTLPTGMGSVRPEVRQAAQQVLAYCGDSVLDAPTV